MVSRSSQTKIIRISYFTTYHGPLSTMTFPPFWSTPLQIFGGNAPLVRIGQERKPSSIWFGRLQGSSSGQQLRVGSSMKVVTFSVHIGCQVSLRATALTLIRRRAKQHLH